MHNNDDDRKYLIIWPLTGNNQNGVQYIVQIVKIYKNNQLNHLFNWREVEGISGIDWGILLGTLRTYCASKGGSPSSSPLRSEGSQGHQANIIKLAQGTIRLKFTQIRLFLWWPGRRLVCISGGQLKAYILWGCSNESFKTTPGSLETKPENKMSDSLKKSQFTLSRGVDEGGVVDEDDDWWEPIKLVTGPCDSDSGYWWNLAENSV
jgi:hypothetical protein